MAQADRFTRAGHAGRLCRSGAMLLVAGLLLTSGCCWFGKRCCGRSKEQTTPCLTPKPCTSRPQVEWPEPIHSYRGVDRTDDEAVEPLWFSDDQRDNDRDRVERLGQHLTKTLDELLGEACPEVTFDVLDNEIPRRHHSSDGTIYVTTGLVRSAADDSDLTGVLALELAELLHERENTTRRGPSKNHKPTTTPFGLEQTATEIPPPTIFDRWQNTAPEQPKPEVLQRAHFLWHKADIKPASAP